MGSRFYFKLEKGGENTKKTVSKIWFPLAVTLVMVLGSFVVMVPAPGAMTHVGDRGGDYGARDLPEAVSYFDLIANEQGSNLQIEGMTDTGELAALAGEEFEVAEVGLPPISKEDHVKVVNVQPREEGTRSPGVDAGGPYGGDTTFEGATLTFTCTVDDPTLIFFRWDLDNDGEWDTPWRFSLTMSDSIDHTYMDDYYDVIVCEVWDGFSKYTNVYTGTTMEGQWPTHYVTYWYYWRNVGWKFEALAPLQISRLGGFRWNTYSTPYYATLWDADSRTYLAWCTLPRVDLSWNWCSIPTQTLTPGKNYMISIVTYNQYTRGPLLWYNPTLYTNLIDPEIAVYYYYSSSPTSWPTYGPTLTNYIPMADFEYYYYEEVLLTESDTADVEVNNIAPTVLSVSVSPSIGKEGEPVYFSGTMEDAGIMDDWQVRVHFGDGNTSGWQGVSKWDYTPAVAAKVLFATTWGASYMPSILSNFQTACGAFCTTIDNYDWYVTGSPPDLDYMLQYDVTIVGTNYIPSSSLAASMGDRLADYSDAGGAVVQHWSSFHTSDRITGRWTDENYNAIVRGGLYYGWTAMDVVHEPGHPVMAGVTAMSAYYSHNSNDVTPGAVRIADYAGGRVLAAVRDNPNDFGTSICGLAYWPNPSYITGDATRMMVNCVKWAAQTKEPKEHPLDFGPIEYIYMDDNPTTTPYDEYEYTIEIWDDDHGKIIIDEQDTLMTENFQSGCNYYSWPAGWSADSTHWYCAYSSYLSSNAAQNWYGYYNFYGDLRHDVSYDLSPYTFVNFGFRHNLDMTWPYGETHAYVQGSIDGGATYPYTVAEWHHGGGAPAGSDAGAKVFSCPWAVGQSDVRFRFHVYNYDDWWWHVDDVWLEGLTGEIIDGADEMSGTVLIENVMPGESGGSGTRGAPSSSVVDEMEVVYFQDYRITDPALWIDTEWFAYKWDMDDGYTQPWIYKGSMASPKDVLKVLFVHSYCDQYSPNCESGDAATVKALVESGESIISVDLWDLFNRLVAPSISTMLSYDIIMTGFNWGWNPSYEPRWITVREDLGDRLADFLDMNGGGVVTFTPSLDGYLFAGYPVFKILGRYVDDKYPPYETATTNFMSGPLATIYYPDHAVMNKIEPGSVSGTLHGGDHTTTSGGGGMAAGMDGINLADWTGDLTAVGVKTLLNDAYNCHINTFTPYMGGAKAATLINNCALWTWGFAPTPVIPDFAYAYGDNGEYNVDLMIVDDDMGWVWDGTDLVADPRYPQTISHSYTPITVNNVDPTIESVSATIDMELCIRMSGNKGNMATLTLTGSDGYFDQVVAKRVPGKPVEACLDTATLDLTPRTQYEVGIMYDPEDDDGANPTWIFQTKFPDGKIKELRHTFKSELGLQTWLVANKQVKRLAIGQEIHFESVASDPGSDDLAFIWGWSDRTPYDICIYEHPGMVWGCAESDYLEELPFPEPDFTVLANDIRSPEIDPIRARDHQTHVFGEQYFYYVSLIVADDDVKDPYPSTYLTPGLDMEIIELDF